MKRIEEAGQRNPKSIVKIRYQTSDILAGDLIESPFLLLFAFAEMTVLRIPDLIGALSKMESGVFGPQHDEVKESLKTTVLPLREEAKETPQKLEYAVPYLGTIS